MGKYIKKGKITGDVAVMEVPQSALGVRTRAKTLALQQNSDVCYLQLRSRRLEKPQFPTPSPQTKQEKQMKTKQSCKQSNRGGNYQAQNRRAGSRLRIESVNSGLSGPDSFSRSKKVEVDEEDGEGCSGKFGSGSRSTSPRDRRKAGGIQTEEVDDLGVEASFGENNLEFDGTGRTMRDSTPCSLIRDLGNNRTPDGSGAMSRRRVQDPTQTSIASTHEMEDFFATAERQQQDQFMDKYNFDVSNDLPLPGRYEWVRVDP